MSSQNQPAFLILGAGGGIGSALAKALSQRGARLLLAGRRLDKLEQLAEECSAEAAECDATQASEVEGAVEKAVEAFGGLDGVANCVGSLLLKPIHLTTEKEWQETLRINLGSAFNTVRAAVKPMRKSGGSIVLCSTAASLTGLANHEAIAAAKGGINGLVLAAAASYASRGIRVNAVAPGMTRTPLTERLTSNPAILKNSTALHALGRIGEPEDIASAMAWLLSPENDWVTGQILAVDGGLSSLQARTA